jgi:CRP-like cAMP-binding protein
MLCDYKFHLLADQQEGGTVEVATVGYEGMVGLSSFFGSRRLPLKALSQIPGEAYRLNVQIFEQEVQKNNALSRIVRRYSQALFIQLSQTVACNRLHSIEERCAKWLLQTADRVGSDTFPLTQEFLGQMLGVRRATVNMVAKILQTNRLIQYKRGVIKIVNRKELQSVSCDCYTIIQKEYEDFARYEARLIIFVGRPKRSDQSPRYC